MLEIFRTLVVICGYPGDTQQEWLSSQAATA